MVSRGLSPPSHFPGRFRSPVASADMALRAMPGARREAYDYISSYAPYENVEAKDYPAIMVTAGLTDPRVTYWEPAKWVARLREHKTDGNPLLLKTYMEAGHAGKSGRFEQLREVALVYAFILEMHERLDAEPLASS